LIAVCLTLVFISTNAIHRRLDTSRRVPVRQTDLTTSDADADATHSTCPYTFTNHGVPSIPNPKIKLVWWSPSSYWAGQSSTRSKYTKALSTLAQNTNFWSPMHEYGVTGGSYDIDIILPVTADTKCVTHFTTFSCVPDSHVRSELISYFNAHAGTADPGTVYVVMLPLTYKSTVGSAGGHHFYLQLGVQKIPFAVIDAVSSDIKHILPILTHELFEATTDATLSGWIATPNELCDVCSATKTLSGYTVTTVWMQKHCRCG